MRLNKYLASSGIASRRKSDELIKLATTEVNGKICLDPAYNVKPGDKVLYDGEKITQLQLGKLEWGSVTSRATIGYDAERDQIIDRK